MAKPVRGKDHAARLESFYSGQAEAYDDFRRRLLQGREAMYRSIPVPEGGVWVDLGGGTGANLEPIGAELHKARKVYLVDLCDSLLAVARKRCEARGWKNVEAVAADATTFRPADGPADVVTFSYSLTMIPDWFAAIDNALAMLRPGRDDRRDRLLRRAEVSGRGPRAALLVHADLLARLVRLGQRLPVAGSRSLFAAELPHRATWKRSGRRCPTFR